MFHFYCKIEFIFKLQFPFLVNYSTEAVSIQICFHIHNLYYSFLVFGFWCVEKSFDIMSRSFGLLNFLKLNSSFTRPFL